MQHVEFYCIVSERKSEMIYKFPGWLYQVKLRVTAEEDV